MAMELSIEDRREKALEMLVEKGFMSLAELVQALGVSESTIRRDLEVLEEQGSIRRTHGGAVSIKDTSTHRLAFSEREIAAVDEKKAISRAVAQLIPENQTVIINGGTTCFQVAQALAGRRLNVITNSVPIAAMLSTDLATEVTLLGGYVYPRTGLALGAMAEQMLEGLHATQLVMSCAGICPDGVYNINQMMVDLERKMMVRAEQCILVVDHTKLARRSVVKMAEPNEFDVIVVDAAVNSENRHWLEKLGSKIVYAP